MGWLNYVCLVLCTRPSRYRATQSPVHATNQSNPAVLSSILDTLAETRKPSESVGQRRILALLLQGHKLFMLRSPIDGRVVGRSWVQLAIFPSSWSGPLNLRTSGTSYNKR